MRPLDKQVEIVDQSRHRRVVAVCGLGLQREAFRERTRANSRPDPDPGLHRAPLRPASERHSGELGNLIQRNRQIASLFERLGNDPREIADVSR